jgi:protein TonB
MLLKPPTRGRRGLRASRAWAFVGIVGMHGLVIAGVLLVKSARPEPEAEPISVMIAIDPVAAPEAPPELAVEMPRIPEVVLVTPVVQITLPPPAPTAIMVAAKPPAPRPEPPAPPAPGNEPVEVSQADYLEPVRPVYPAAAKRARAQGTVLVKTLVDTEGRPKQVLVHESSGFAALDRAACDAVMKALFKPYRQNGVPRSMLVIVPIEFSLTVRTAHR